MFGERRDKIKMKEAESKKQKVRSKKQEVVLGSYVNIGSDCICTENSICVAKTGMEI